MSENSKSYYIYINSKNRDANDNIYNFNVYLNNTIIVNRNQGINLSVVGFSMLKTDYNIKNSHFRVDSLRLNDNYEETFNYNIPDGNYNYISLMEYLNTILSGKIKVEYIKHRNCFKFTNLNPSNYDYYLIPENSNKILGIYDEITLSTFEGSYINLTNYSHIIIRSNAIIFEDNTQDNFYNKEFGNSNILFMLDIQDIPPFHLISYKNYDNGNNYSYNISNKQITSFDLQLFNEKNEVLTDTDDYFLIIKIVIFNKENVSNSNNSDVFSDIRFLLMSLLFNTSKNKNVLLK